MCCFFVWFSPYLRTKLSHFHFPRGFTCFRVSRRKNTAEPCNEAAAQRISAYTSGVLRKVCSLLSKSSSLFVTVLLSVNRNFSPRAIPRSPCSRTFLASRLAAGVHAPESERPFRLFHPASTLFRSLSSLPWRPRG